MNRFVQRLLFTSICQLLVLLLVIGGTARAANTKLHVVTDIAPVHSLVSMVVAGGAETTLLIQPAQSPHAFSLKPSQRRAMNQAQLIVLMSEAFTPSLHRYLETAKRDNAVLILSEHNGPHSHTPHENNPESDHDATPVLDQSSSPTHSAVLNENEQYDLENDLHAWLNPENAIDWLDKIATAMARIDPPNANLYKNNAAMAIQQLAALHIELQESLKPVRSREYIVYHDAYQHFAKSYALRPPIAIALSDARSPGAAKLRAIRAQAMKVSCAFSEVLHDDAIVDMITQQLPIKRGILDPIGTNQSTGESLYPNLMRTLAQQFVDCLSD